MPQIEFDGQGLPIPTIALPPFGSDGDLPPTSFTYTDNADFPVAQYIEFGYTHFEVWCVGAAGGRGGDSSIELYPIYDEVYRPVPLDVWNIWLSQFDGTTIYYGWDPADISRGGTQRDIQEFNNPSHMLKFRTYQQFLLFPTVQGIGGGGGGGGMHKAAGLLEDLPDTASVVVGKAGANAPRGHIHHSGVWVPDVSDDLTTTYPNPFFNTYLNTYPPPQNAYSNPQVGQDGGASTFGGTVCQASGGKGGAPGMIWDGAHFVIDGHGGDGGLGGRSLAGGGGAGSSAEGMNGVDGIWHPETGIGGGGGGGKGGRAAEFIGDPRFGALTRVDHLATAGGQGSYSFGDTSVYGPRQYRQPWTYLAPQRTFGMTATPGPYGTYPTSLPNGGVTLTPITDPYLAVPGGGGGARPIKNLKAGSFATGFSPDGIVVLRLTRLV